MSGVRVVAGVLRGRRLPVPAGVRPTGARVREALFSIWGERIAGCHLLDLFAGSGGVGFEALSRGAAQVLWVEAAPRVAASLRASCRELAGMLVAGDCEVQQLRLPEGLRRAPERRFELAFADPPYAFSAHAALLEAVRGWLVEGGELVLEHAARCEPELPASGWSQIDRRRYGDSCLTFFRCG